MARVAIVTDSASDIPPARAAERGISVVPLLVRFGDTEYRSGIDLSTEAFWARLTAPDAPFPKTAACSPGEFQRIFQERFDAGAASVVCVTVGSKLSATHQSAIIARDAMRGREVHIVDSETASMGIGSLAELAADLADQGLAADQIARVLEARRGDSKLYVVLETLEYLKRGGRISGARAAIGTVLSVKPIITIEDGVVETADKPRTRGKARERLLELLTERPVERIDVLHGMAPGIEAFADELARRAGVDRGRVTIQPIGPTVGPHVGPGAYGAVMLRQPAEVAAVSS
jgi:DegV family protein with EDD domain